MKKSEFEEFKVYEIDNKYSFVYVDINDDEKFLTGLVNYIFNEENLLLYSELSTGLEFKPGKREYVKLYKNIQYFLNEELMKIPVGNVDEELVKILSEEYECIKGDNGEYLIKQDKGGKIGEYIFHLLLTKYFNYTCIIPKFCISTDRNMSVYGIDTLFYDEKKSEILFGEAKFSNRFSNGIKLINKSLKEYEQNIKEEFLLVLSNDSYKLNESFKSRHKEKIDECFTFEEFIEEANLTTIVIPIFIAHGDGKRNTVEKFMKKLNSIKTKDMFGMNTKYMLISLPVIDKDKFIEFAIKMAVKKSHEYKEK